MTYIGPLMVPEAVSIENFDVPHSGTTLSMGRCYGKMPFAYIYIEEPK